jgi:PAS domain S-box-containing protein
MPVVPASTTEFSGPEFAAREAVASGFGMGAPTAPRVGGCADRGASARPLMIAAAVAAAITVALVVLLQLLSGSAVAQDVGDSADMMAALIAGLACVRAARRGGVEARGWALLAVGMLVWAAAGALWAYYGLTRAHSYPFPSVADAGFLGYAVPTAGALLVFPRVRLPGVSGMRVVADGLLIATGVLFVSGATVLGPVVLNLAEPGSTRIVAIAYPVVDVAIASLVLILALRRPAGARLPWVFLGSGLIVLAVCDSTFVALPTAGGEIFGTPFQAGWVAAFLLIALATLVPARPAQVKVRRHFTVVQELLPYLPVLAAVIVMAVHLPRLLEDPFLATSGALLLVVLIAQQVLVAVEKVRLADDLESTVVLRSEQLRAADVRFRSLVQSSDDAIVGQTVAGVVTSWNAAAERLYGYRMEEIVGKSMHVIVPPDRRAEEVAILAAAGAGEHRKRYESIRLRKDGSTVPVALTVSPILDGTQVQGVSIIGTDISERRRTEEALHAQQVQTRAIIDTATDPFIAMDEQGLITDWNRAAEHTLGWSRDEAVGRVLAETIVPLRYRDAHQQGLRRVVGGGNPRVLGTRVDLQALHRDGSELQVELLIWRAGAGGGGGFNAFLHDITDRTRAAAELASARDEALKGTLAKSEFLASMSHEIRTPMNGVIGLTALLLDTGLTEVQRRYATGVQGAGEALLAIIDSILDLSKLEAGRVELEQLDFDPRQLVEVVGLLLASTAADKGLELIAYCAPEVPAAVRGDPGRLRQVLLNLLSNAVKFTARGEVVLSVDIVEGGGAQTAGEAVLRFAVTDTGLGIDPETTTRLFHPFTQADASTTRRFGGTGLGLTICQRLVGAMGSQIQVDSVPGTGSTFSFTVTLLSSPAASVLVVPRPDPLTGIRVLVAEDNHTNRMVLCGQLRAWGMHPDGAADADAGLQLLRAAAGRGAPYTVAVIDQCMPDRHGVQLAAAIATDPSLTETRTVLLTSAEPVNHDVRTHAGVLQWVHKPVRSSELFDALMTLGAPSAPAAAPGDARSTPAAPTAPRPSAARGRVLVVEDNEVNQLVAQGMLRTLGFTVEFAADGAQALAALATEAYDLVLMDCHMPGMDGFQATTELRRREHACGAGEGGEDDRRRTPVIAMTAGVLVEDRQRCLAAGMDDFVAKPVDMHLLERALHRQLSAADPTAPRAL